MTNFGETYKKGTVLMQNALKKYAEGNYEGGDIDRKEANKYFEMAEKEMNVAVTNATMLYGENRNFGIIFHVIEESIPSLIKEKKTDTLKGIVKFIKNNKVLNEEFNFYQKMLNAKNIVNENDFIEDMCLLKPKHNKQTIIENNERLIEFIKNNDINELIDINEDKLKIYEAIEFLMLSDKTFNNIETYSNVKTILKEHIVKCNENKINNNVEKYKNTLESVCEKYSNDLNDDEIKLIESLSGNEETKQKLFEEIKTDTITLLEKEITEDDDNKDRMEKIVKVVENKTYNKETLLKDISHMLEIQETLK